MAKPTAPALFLQDTLRRRRFEHFINPPDPQIQITDDNAAPITDGGYLTCPRCGEVDMRRDPDHCVDLNYEGVSMRFYCAANNCGSATLDLIEPEGMVHLSWRHSTLGRKGS